MFVTEMFDTTLSIKCESKEYLSFNVVISICGVIILFWIRGNWQAVLFIQKFDFGISLGNRYVCLCYENVLSTDMLYSRYLRNVSVLPILNLIQSYIPLYTNAIVVSSLIACIL